MKQVLQNLQTGTTEVLEVPYPQVKPGYVLIRTHYSLISAGTERMLLEFSKSNLIMKARQQPDKVKMVLDKIKTDGLQATLTAVRNKLDTALPMGYCHSGVILAVGEGVSEFKPGDRVVSNGAHAEAVLIPRNLCVKLPNQVTLEIAPFAVLGAISLQGIRLAAPALGESCAVIGMGLIGLLTAQLLRAQGCRVIGFDYNADRLALAERWGITSVNLTTHPNAVDAGLDFSQGYGIDAVFIATATQSTTPIRHAAQISRKRGKVVLIGVAGLDISRADFYEKELSFQVSCSYGPGRYDPQYEEAGHDYPYPFVRWTERRNIQAVLEMMAEKRLEITPLISHRFSFTEVVAAYQHLSENTSTLGILIEYPQPEAHREKCQTIQLIPVFEKERLGGVLRPFTLNPSFSKKKLIQTKIGFIGAGNFANQILIPAFRKTSAQVITVAAISGISSILAARKHNISLATTDTHSVLTDESIDAVVISTRHHNHAQLVCQALTAGKHVYVEKPLCLTPAELAEISQTVNQNPQLVLMVGFNRRFSSLIQKTKILLNQTTAPKCLVMTINAGKVPATHWIQNPEIGGGRIIGECCHFIDLLRFLTGHAIVDSSIYFLQDKNLLHQSDTASIQLKFADQSIGTIHYFANGHRSFPKESLEIFCQGRILKLDNFRNLKGYGWSNFKKFKLWRQDKGHEACAQSFVNNIISGHSTIPFHELYEVTSTCIGLTKKCAN